MALSRDAILEKATKPRLEEFHVPAWADDSGDDLIYLRGLSGDEAERFQEQSALAGESVRSPKDAGLTAQTIRPCITDENGESLFPNEDDAKLIGKLGFSELNRIAMKVLEMSGITEAGQDNIEGNSGAGKTGETESGSPESTTTAPTTSS